MHPCGHGKDAVPASAASWEDLKPVPPRSDGKILFSPEGDGALPAHGAAVYSALDLGKWRYDWVLAQDMGPDSIWSSPAAETFETGISGGTGANSFLNAWLSNVTSGTWSCYHIPVPTYFDNDYVSRGTKMDSSSDSLPKEWAVPSGKTPGMYELKGGPPFEGRHVTLYNNTDVWVQCPQSELGGACSIITAVDGQTGRVIRQFYVQPANSFSMDLYDFVPANASVPSWQRVFDVPAAYSNITCIDVSGGNGTGLYDVNNKLVAA